MSAHAIDYLPPKLRSSLGSHTGIIREICLQRRNPGEKDLYYSAAAICDTGVLWNTGSWKPKAGGVGVKPADAVMSALGEAIERYCCAFQKPGIQTKYHELITREKAIRPSSLSNFSHEQYKRVNAKPADPDNLPLRWLKGRNLPNRFDVWVPAAWVYLPYAETEIYVPGNSTGLACGPDYESAALNAVLEVVERDAYVHTWLFRGHPPRVSIGHTDFGRELGELVPFDHWNVTIYDITGNLGIPVFLVAMRPPRSEYAYGETSDWYCQGVAAHLDGRIAIRKALLEACLSLLFFEQKFREDRGAWKNNSDVSHVTDFEQHSIFYNASAKSRKHLTFLDKGQELIWENTRGSKGIDHAHSSPMRTLAQALEQSAITGALVDLTTDDVRDSGLTVVRAILENFPWLHGDHHWPFLGTPRLRTPHLHYPFIDPPKGLIEKNINPWPHAMG